MSNDRVGGGSPRSQVLRTEQTHGKQPTEAPKKTNVVRTEAKPTGDVFDTTVRARVVARGSGQATVESSGPFALINRAADSLGDVLRKGGERIARGGQALEGRVPVAGQLRQLGETARQMGRGIQDAPEAAVATADKVQRQVNGLIQQGQELLHRAEQEAQPLIAQGVETVRGGITSVRNELDAMRKGVTDFVQSITQATDFRTQIDKLGTGDKYTVSLGGSASVQGAKAYGVGQIEVSREKDKYTVSMDGKGGVGLFGQLGASLGVKAEASGEATLGVGGKMEFKFATAEEAKRATEALLRQAASMAAGVTAGALAQQAIRPSAEDLRLLSQNISALELRGEVAAKLGGELGLGERGIAAAGLFGEGRAEALTMARIEFEQGRPPTLVTKKDISGEVSSGLKAGLDYGKGAQKSPTEGSLLPSLGGSAKGTVSEESRVTLPSNINLDNLLREPVGTLRDAGVEVLNSAQYKVTVSLESNGQALGTGVGLEAKAEFTAHPAKLLRSGAIQQALRGRFEDAFKAAGDTVDVNATLTPFSKHGVSLSPEVSLMGFGVGLEGQAVRQDMADKPLREFFTGKATEVGQSIHQFIKDHPELGRAARTPAQLSTLAGGLHIIP